jgi:predicted ATPase/class 3 adenylate cyclase
MDAVRRVSSGPPTRLPTGEVTFLFTDIEGSTVRWERDPAAMQHALQRHDEVMRSAIVDAGGFVFKTVGDAFYAAFQEPAGAVAAAVLAQQRLGAEDFSAVGGLRVRMAVHTGSTHERDGDYFGQTLNRVARILSIGHGGQILLSAACEMLTAGKLPPHSTVRDLGEHRLKDLSAPERVFQLVAAELDSEFPKLRSLSVLDNNLPQQLTSLVGRDDDVAAIKGLLGSSKLVTLIGSGGVGKTRCALQVGAELLESYPGGVWFVDFAALHDPRLVANTIGAAIELQEAGSRPMLDSLVAHLRGKKLLLILDNCEHLIAEISRVAAALLHNCEGISILATSREHINIDGESLYRMPSLTVPEQTAGLTAEAAAPYGAISLFVARAQAMNQRFALSDDNAPVVAEICKRLDGIPLAIELAAARVKVLAPKALAQKLNERFRLLTGGHRTALPRQQTMRAAIDWSYDLLAPDEQRLFRALSIFAGSFAPETTAAVCADEELDEYEIFTHVASLADKSLVNVEHGADDEVRYRLLESTREYAAEKLAEAGETEAAAHRHAEAYADLAERIVAEYDSVPYRLWLPRAEAEIENVRAALAWSFGEHGGAHTGRRLAATLHRSMAGSSAQEARRWIALAIERGGDGGADLDGRLALAQAHLGGVLNQWAATLESARAAIAFFERAGNARGEADAQRWAGRALFYLGRVREGEALLEASLATHRKLGSRTIGATLRDLAVTRGAAGDVERSRRLFEEALRDFQRHEDDGNVAQTAGTLAGVEFGAGNVEAALRFAAQALAAARTLKRRRMIAWILGEMATFSLSIDAFDDARAQARESLTIARELSSALHVAYSLQHLAAVSALRPEPEDTGSRAGCERGARILGFVDVRLSELQTVREPAEEAEYRRALEQLDASLGAPRRETLSAEGASWNEDQAVWAAMAV